MKYKIYVCLIIKSQDQPQPNSYTTALHAVFFCVEHGINLSSTNDYQTTVLETMHSN